MLLGDDGNELNPNSQAYENLWDDINKQFLQNTLPSVLTSAIRAINHLTLNTSMQTTNNTKLSELQESLFSSLRETLGDDTDIFSMSLEEDRLAAVEAALLRLVLMCRMRDCVEVMEGEDGGIKGWDVVSAFAERGDVGYKEEAKVSDIKFAHDETDEAM
jgi:cohesin complex subunit SA-1/2